MKKLSISVALACALGAPVFADSSPASVYVHSAGGWDGAGLNREKTSDYTPVGASYEVKVAKPENLNNPIGGANSVVVANINNNTEAATTLKLKDNSNLAVGVQDGTTSPHSITLSDATSVNNVLIERTAATDDFELGGSQNGLKFELIPGSVTTINKLNLFNHDSLRMNPAAISIKNSNNLTVTNGIDIGGMDLHLIGESTSSDITLYNDKYKKETIFDRLDTDAASKVVLDKGSEASPTVLNAPVEFIGKIQQIESGFYANAQLTPPLPGGVQVVDKPYITVKNTISAPVIAANNVTFAPAANLKPNRVSFAKVSDGPSTDGSWSKGNFLYTSFLSTKGTGNTFDAGEFVLEPGFYPIARFAYQEFLSDDPANFFPKDPICTGPVKCSWSRGDSLVVNNIPSSPVINDLTTNASGSNSLNIKWYYYYLSVLAATPAPETPAAPAPAPAPAAPAPEITKIPATPLEPAIIANTTAFTDPAAFAAASAAVGAFAYAAASDDSFAERMGELAAGAKSGAWARVQLVRAAGIHASRYIAQAGADRATDAAGGTVFSGIYALAKGADVSDALDLRLRGLGGGLYASYLAERGYVDFNAYALGYSARSEAASVHAGGELSARAEAGYSLDFGRFSIISSAAISATHRGKMSAAGDFGAFKLPAANEFSAEPALHARFEVSPEFSIKAGARGILALNHRASARYSLPLRTAEMSAAELAAAAAQNATGWEVAGSQLVDETGAAIAALNAEYASVLANSNRLKTELSLSYQREGFSASFEAARSFFAPVDEYRFNFVLRHSFN